MGKDADDCCEACGMFAHDDPVVIEQPKAPLLAERGGLRITIMGRGDMRSIVPTGDVITIGRGKDNDIVLDDVALSRRQARIRLVDGEVLVEDTDSVCGTFLDGHRVQSAAAREGSIVFFGYTRLVLNATRTR